MKNFTTLILSLFFAGIFTSSAAFALPIHRPFPLIAPAQMSDNYDFEGIVALDDCSGALVRYETSQDSDKALVFTNGHCNETGFLDPGVVLTNLASSREFTLFDSKLNTVANLTADRILYATMTKTDLTIYELPLTYADILKQYGIHALTLSSQHPAQGVGIEVLSGYWQNGYACQIETFVTHLHEGDWVWDDSIRYSRPGCETIGGTSGSPVIQAGTRTMIGINNTGNESGEKCTENNPCEVDPSGNITYVQGYSYGEQTYWIYSCLNSSRQLDLTMPTCQLLH